MRAFQTISKRAVCAGVVAVSASLLPASGVDAAPAVAGQNQATVYTVSSTDLLNGLQPAATGNFGSTFGEGFAGTLPGVLTTARSGAPTRIATAIPLQRWPSRTTRR